MKKLFLLAICICFCFSCGCSKKQEDFLVAEKQADAVSQNEQVAYELEKIEGIENFDDETIKALSVILRTNLLKNETLPDSNTTTSNQRLVELASQTDGEILVEENSNSFEPFKITAEVTLGPLIKQGRNSVTPS